MIISDKYQYLFIEVPHTASTALSKELCDLYGGVNILSKHATYFEFARTATEAQKQYFVFAGIRNPLDAAVTKYFRLKSNPKKKYENTSSMLKNGGTITQDRLRRFEFIRNSKADFADYFKKFYRLAYADISCSAYENCDFVIHFENLQNDFATVLKRLGIEPKRRLPQANKTVEKKETYLDYYTPDIRGQAVRVFSPYMERYGYAFPPQWGHASTSLFKRLEYQVLLQIKMFVWKHVRFSDRFYGQAFRHVR